MESRGRLREATNHRCAWDHGMTPTAPTGHRIDTTSIWMQTPAPTLRHLLRAASIAMLATLALLTITGALFREDLRADASTLPVPTEMVGADTHAVGPSRSALTPDTVDVSAVEATAGDVNEEEGAAVAPADNLAPDVVTDAAPDAVTDIVHADNIPARVPSGEASSATPWYLRAISLAGIFVFLLIAWAMSEHRTRVNWRLVSIGLLAQFLIVLFILKTSVGKFIFSALGAGFMKILSFTNEGSKLVFGSFAAQGEIMPALASVAFMVFPTIIFFSSLTALLYHWRVLPWVVQKLGALMRVTMGSSGAESLSAAGNIFVGMTESPLLVRPYIGRMTMSELMSVMTVGFATVAGGVMATYIALLQPHIPNIAEHLMAASVMSAPGGLVVAKLLWPETEVPVTRDGNAPLEPSAFANAIDAAADGAWNGAQLVIAVGAMLMAFVSLVALFNWLIAVPSYIQHGIALDMVWQRVSDPSIVPPDLAARCALNTAAFEARAGCVHEVSALSDAWHSSAIPVWETYSLQRLLGWVFYPVALLSGVSTADAPHLAELYGQRFVLNEFYAYFQLSAKMSDPSLSLDPRTILIASYGLCGFANIGSIAIQLGGIGGMAPERRSDLARLGFRAMIGGTLTTWITANIVGLLI